MARKLEAWWTPSPFGPTRAERLSGRYFPYQPDPLVGRPLSLSADVRALSERVERSILDLAHVPGIDAAQALARFLLRAEAIDAREHGALEVSSLHVGTAERIRRLELHGHQPTKATAQAASTSLAALVDGVRELASAEHVTMAGLVRLHDALVWDNPSIRGVREAQNWVGGSDYHPFEALYVPPPPELVRELLADIADYLDRSDHPPLIQAGLSYAQMETAHPAPDGNTRWARGAVHTALLRRGVTPDLLLPIGAVLITQHDLSHEALMRYRYEGSPSSSAAQNGVNFWLTAFLEATDTAVAHVKAFATELHATRGRWQEALTAQLGPQEGVVVPHRSLQLADLLPKHPVVTPIETSQLLNLPIDSAMRALQELGEVGVLRKRSVSKTESVHIAVDLFGAADRRQRRLATPDGEAAERTAPNRPAPWPAVASGTTGGVRAR